MLPTSSTKHILLELNAILCSQDSTVLLSKISSITEAQALEINKIITVLH